MNDTSARSRSDGGGFGVDPPDEFNRELVANVHPAGWVNPEPRVRYNLVVLGAGTAGLVTAAGAAGLGAKVALVERHLMGGDCLNVGCVPSKAPIRASRAVADVRDAGAFGVRVPAGVTADFPAAMERMRRLRAGISPHDSASRFRDLGVDVYFGTGRFTGPDALARIAIQNALFLGRAKASSLTVPWCTYTDPEIAHVGLYEHEAVDQGIPVRTFLQEFGSVDRAVIDGESEGFVKVHVRAGTDRILGATVVARHAGEMISELTLAMVGGLGLKDLARTIHPYPTQAEAFKKVGDAYSRTRLTPLVLGLFRRWLAWTR
ncbi:MAG: FAD-dependent oxidoreductase [Planctomycetia bacterium]|nr:FAD-dependent oxidoreductase [Planctomycetia bacterium]